MSKSTSSKQYIMNTATEVQSIIDTLDDEDRIKLGGKPGTPYMLKDDEDDYAKRFIARNTAGQAVGFLDLCWASNNALSAVVVTSSNVRGQGIANRLIEEMIAWLNDSDEAQEMGIVKINWFARRDNPASLYLAHKHGFCERKDYRRDEKWWGGVLWRDNCETLEKEEYKHGTTL